MILPLSSDELRANSATTSVSNWSDEWEEVSKGEAAGVLRAASQTNRSNLEALDTWSGECRLTDALLVNQRPPRTPDEQPQTGVFLRRYVTDVKFACNLKDDLLNTSFKPVGGFAYEDMKTAETVNVDAKGSETLSVLTPEHCLQFRPNASPMKFDGDPALRGWDPAQSRVVRRQSREFGKRFVDFGDVFDPRSIFIAPGANPQHLDLQFAYEAFSEGSAPGSRVRLLKLRGANASYRLVNEYKNPSASDDSVVFLTDFKESDGMNFETVEAARNNALLWRCKIEYVRIGDFIVPCSYLYEQFDDATGNVKLSRQVSVARQSINEPLDNEELFTHKAFGSKPGDRVVDEVNHQLLMIGNDGDLVPVSAFQRQYGQRFVGHRSADENAGGDMHRIYFILANVGVIVLLLAVLGRRYLATRA